MSQLGIKNLIEKNENSNNQNLSYGIDFDIVEVYDKNEDGKDKKIKILDSALNKEIIEKEFSLENLKTASSVNSNKPHYRIILENNSSKLKKSETEPDDDSEPKFEDYHYSLIVLYKDKVYYFDPSYDENSIMNEIFQGAEDCKVMNYGLQKDKESCGDYVVEFVEQINDKYNFVKQQQQNIELSNSDSLEQDKFEEYLKSETEEFLEKGNFFKLSQSRENLINALYGIYFKKNGRGKENERKEKEIKMGEERLQEIRKILLDMTHEGKTIEEDFTEKIRKAELELKNVELELEKAELELKNVELELEKAGIKLENTEKEKHKLLYKEKKEQEEKIKNLNEQTLDYKEKIKRFELVLSNLEKIKRFELVLSNLKKIKDILKKKKTLNSYKDMKGTGEALQQEIDKKKEEHRNLLVDYIKT